jgi:hypothetical protein
MTTELTIRAEVPVKHSSEVRFDEALPPELPTILPNLAQAMNVMEKYISSHAPTLFDRLVAERQGIVMLEGVLEGLKSERDNLIGLAMDIKGETNVSWENFMVTRRKGAKPRSIIDKKLLMTATDFCPNCGEEIIVTPTQIDKATKIGSPGKPGIVVKPVKGSSDVEQLEE